MIGDVYDTCAAYWYEEHGQIKYQIAEGCGNEFECGSNHARSMASYSLLLAMSRLDYELVTGLFGFDPVRWDRGRFQCVWSLGTGWGTLACTPASAEVAVLAGDLTIRQLHVPYMSAPEAIHLGDADVTGWLWDEGLVVFEDGVTIAPGRGLSVR